MVWSWEMLSWLLIILIFIIGSVLKFFGLFDVFNWITKRFELRDREERIENIEKINEIMKENLKKLLQLIEIKAVWLSHDLREIAPKIDVQLIFNNHSIYDVQLMSVSYTPILVGVSGAKLKQTDKSIDQIIPHQNSFRLTESFYITEPIRKKLVNWRDKSLTEVNFHLDVKWLLHIQAKLKYKEEFIIGKEAEASKWAHHL